MLPFQEGNLIFIKGNRSMNLGEDVDHVAKVQAREKDKQITVEMTDTKALVYSFLKVSLESFFVIILFLKLSQCFCSIIYKIFNME